MSGGFNLIYFRKLLLKLRLKFHTCCDIAIVVKASVCFVVIFRTGFCDSTIRGPFLTNLFWLSPRYTVVDDVHVGTAVPCGTAWEGASADGTEIRKPRYCRVCH